MRPDEHKKRKNAQYKKAHGIERKSEGVKSAKQKDKNSLTSQNDGTRGKNEESKKEAFGSGKKEQPNHQIQKVQRLSLSASGWGECRVGVRCQFVAST